MAQKMYTLFTHQYLWNKFKWYRNLFQRYWWVKSVYFFWATPYIARPASNEIFSPSNKIQREVGRTKDLSAPRQNNLQHTQGKFNLYNIVILSQYTRIKTLDFFSFIMGVTKGLRMRTEDGSSESYARTSDQYNGQSGQGNSKGW